MIGANITLQCYATNTINGTTYNISSAPIFFNVASGKLSEQNGEVGGSTTSHTDDLELVDSCSTIPPKPTEL